MGNDQSHHFAEQSDEVVIQTKTREADDDDIPADAVRMFVSKMPCELIGIETQVKIGTWTVFMGDDKKTHLMDEDLKEFYICTAICQPPGENKLSDWTKHESEINEVIAKLNAMMQIDEGRIRFGNRAEWMKPSGVQRLGDRIEVEAKLDESDSNRDIKTKVVKMPKGLIGVTATVELDGWEAKFSTSATTNARKAPKKRIHIDTSFPAHHGITCKAVWDLHHGDFTRIIKTLNERMEINEEGHVRFGSEEPWLGKGRKRAKFEFPDETNTLLIH